MKNSEAHTAEAQFELLIEGLMTKGYGICDGFTSATETAGLRNELLNCQNSGKMHLAGIGKKSEQHINEKIRGDVICWLDENSTVPFALSFVQKLAAFIEYLNQTCFTSINDSEFHFAYYEPGSFYKRHLDTFKSDDARKFSFVLYLNENWNATDEGNLKLYPKGQEPIDVLPIGGRAVFFRSDKLEHEVMPSPNRHRLSIAGWLKSQ